MMNTAIASLALFGGSALAGSYGYSATGVGSAVVVVSITYYTITYHRRCL